jgi:hypothetical protein
MGHQTHSVGHLTSPLFRQGASRVENLPSPVPLPRQPTSFARLRTVHPPLAKFPPFAPLCRRRRSVAMMFATPLCDKMRSTVAKFLNAPETRNACKPPSQGNGFSPAISRWITAEPNLGKKRRLLALSGPSRALREALREPFQPAPTASRRPVINYGEL